MGWDCRCRLRGALPPGRRRLSGGSAGGAGALGALLDSVACPGGSAALRAGLWGAPGVCGAEGGGGCSEVRGVPWGCAPWSAVRAPCRAGVRGGCPKPSGGGCFVLLGVSGGLRSVKGCWGAGVSWGLCSLEGYWRAGMPGAVLCGGPCGVTWCSREGRVAWRGMRGALHCTVVQGMPWALCYMEGCMGCSVLQGMLQKVVPHGGTCRMPCDVGDALGLLCGVLWGAGNAQVAVLCGVLWVAALRSSEGNNVRVGAWSILC